MSQKLANTLHAVTQYLLEQLSKVPPFLLSYGVAVLLQSFLILFMCELATYWYCITQANVRPPLEGIPFFRISVFSLSVAVMGAFYFISFYVGILISICRITLDNANEDAPKKTDEPFLEKMAGKLPISITKSFSMLLTRVSSLLETIPLKSRQLAMAFSVLCIGLYIAIIFFIAGVKEMQAGVGTDATKVVCTIILVTLSLGLWKKTYSAAIRIAGGTVLALYISSYALNPDLFEDFLYDLKFGGFVPVTVEFEGSGGAETSTIVSGHLVIRSSSAMIMTNSLEDATTVQEISLAHVRRITYLNEKRLGKIGLAKLDDDQHTVSDVPKKPESEGDNGQTEPTAPPLAPLNSKTQ